MLTALRGFVFYRIVAVGALVVAGLFLGCPASAQTQQQINWCLGKDGATPDLIIGGCTAMIQSGRYSGKNLAIAFSNRGLAYRAKDDNDRAIQDYDQAIRLNPQYANAYNNRGDTYDDKGQYDRAIADYDQAIRLNPQFADAFNNRGIAYAKKGQYDRAIADYDQAIRLNPQHAKAYNNRGDAYDDKGQYDRAIQDFDQAIRLDPQFAEAFNNRGVAYRKKGQYDRAIQDFDQAIRLNPQDADFFKNRGVTYKNKGQYDRAIQDYGQAIRLNPQDADSFNGRCYSRAIAGQLDQALKDCNESLRLRAKDAAALDSRGFTYLKLGQLDSAIADYDAALTFDPKIATSLYGRGVAKLKKGDEAGGNADIAAAKAIKADIVEEFARYGMLLAQPLQPPTSFKSYRDSMGNYRFDVPKEWQPTRPSEPLTNQNISIFFEGQEMAEGKEVLIDVSISVTKLLRSPQGFSSKDEYDRFRRTTLLQVDALFAPPDPELKEPLRSLVAKNTQDIILAGITGKTYRRDYDYVDPQSPNANPLPISIVDIVLRTPDAYYVLEYRARSDLFEKYKFAWDRLKASFELVTATPAPSSTRSQVPLVQPYKPVAVKRSQPFNDPTFVIFRKQLAYIARHEDRAALAKLVVAQGFFWINDQNFRWELDEDISDQTKPSIDNLIEALGGVADGTAWDILGNSAEDYTAQELPGHRGLLCASDISFNAREFEVLLLQTRTYLHEWGYSSEMIKVRAAPEADSPVIDMLVGHFVRVLPDSATPDANTPSGKHPVSLLRVATPSGKTGFIGENEIRSIGGTYMCFKKESGSWKIAGFLGGAPQKR